jgi:two-component system, cell cycle sensor histidine kinase and response regulator CckA
METRPTYAELEQKIAELSEKVRQQLALENQYRNLVDSTSDSLYLIDADCRYLFMNSNHAQRLNIPRAKTTGLSYKDFHTPEQYSAFEAKVKTVYETGISIHDEHPSSRDGGYFLRTFSPVRDSTDPKKILAVSVVSKDITKRRKVEEALQKSEEKYRQLIEYSSEAIFIITHGKISYANTRTEKMLGYPMDDLQLISFINLVISEDREMVFERQKAILQGDNSVVNYSFRIVSKEGSTSWVESNSVAILWENQPATLNFMRDINKQKRTETKLLQAQKMESIGTLAGGIAHDFNNLLMGIQGHASLTLLKLDKNDPNYEHIKTIETLVMSGANLTKQLLGFARGGKYEVKRVDLNALIYKTSQTIGRTKKEIRIHRNLENNLWSTDVDQGQVEQVLLNLFVNAWQAMPGGGDLYIETKNIILDENRFKPFSGKNSHYVKISVTDTGVGMDEKTKERIFEPFFTTKEMGRGTGLGLASVYGIIKNHNGFINVYSEKGQGATFNIYFPAVVKKADRESHPASDSAVDMSPCSETILIVDDETMILNVAGDMLKTLGYTVFTAQDGAAAVALYKQQQESIDLVILDMVMPDMGGGEVFDELKKINPLVKVLLSSGYSLNGQASRIIDRGCDGFIQKPFTIGDIAKQLRDILNTNPKQQMPQKSSQLPLPMFDSP